MDPSAASQFLRILAIAILALFAAPLTVLFAEREREGQRVDQAGRPQPRRPWRLAFQ